jgi:hypothetical protein
MKTRSLLCALLVGAFVSGTFVLANAADKEMTPDATLTISAKALGAGAGYSWGGGKLHYKGKTYDVDVDGLTVGTVGATMIEATGKVYDLKKLEDFDGTYAAAAAGATIGGGGGATTMKNQNGVTVNMTATTRGVSLTLGASGVKFTVKK